PVVVELLRGGRSDEVVVVRVEDGVALEVALVLLDLVLRNEAGQRVTAEQTGEPVVLTFGEIVGKEHRRTGRLALGLVLVVVALTGIADERTTDIRVRRAVLERLDPVAGRRAVGIDAVDVDVDRLVTTGQHAEL